MRGLFQFLLIAFASARILEFQKAASLPTGWRKTTEPVPAEFKKSFIIAVSRANMDDLESTFWALTDPKSPSYGKYLSLEEVGQRWPANPKPVVEWLESNQIPHTVTVNGDYIFADSTVGQLSALLQTQFFVFEHSSGKKHVGSLGPYHVPDELADSIDVVTGIVGFPLISSSNTFRGSSSSTANITPKVLRARYNVTDVGTQSSNSQAVAEFQGQFFSPADLTQFQNTYVGTTQAVTKIVGQNIGSNPGTEAELDVQYIMGIGQGVPTWFWSVPSMDFWGDLTTWTAKLGNTSNAPWVHSISYGSQGSYPSAAYRTRLDNDFKTFGTRGLSIIFASGDSGTGCSLCYYFQPSFPATSIYVTSVGATTFASGTSGPEVAVTAFGSGGGMSTLFPIPSYQAAAVNNYFSTAPDLPEAHFYNRNGRGTPDVAAMGWDFAVIIDGEVNSVGGTSCAAPTFAGIISLLNDAQIAAGKPTLGFLNNWLYQSAATTKNAFFDVTVGDNQDGCCGYTGFECAPGWDPVTGLGTPNYPVLKSLLP